MTLKSIEIDIAEAQFEFNDLNAGRWKQVFRVRPATSNPKVVPALRYCEFDHQTEARLVELAERISRLMRFKAHLFARVYAEETT